MGTTEIRDQVYDEKQNTVTITVVCCSPEKIRDKLCCKGGKVIKSIEIKPPPKPKEPEKPKAPDQKAKEPGKPKAPEKPKEPEKPPPAEKSASVPVPVPAPKAPEPAPKAPEPAPKAPEPAPKVPEPAPPAPTIPLVPGYGTPTIFPVPVDVCCRPCYEGRAGGPCYHGYGRPEPCYDNYGYGPYDSWGRPCYVSRCDYYLNEENTSACTIM